MSQLQVTGEAKIRDIQGPVVANSGVITALDGAASQYVRGDGTLADFPTSTGGGSSVSYYLNSSVSQGTIGGVAYRELSKEPIIGAGTDITISANGYVASYITDANDPDVLSVPGGNFNCEFYFSVNNNTGNPTTYAELYKYDGTTFTLLGSSQAVPESLNQGTTIAPYYFAIPVATAALALTDRLAIRIYVSVDGRVVTLHTENSHLCQVVTTFSKGMVSLNNLTDQSQFITTGTSGTNFNIVSSGDTHTFNLPVASATNTGKLSNTDWSTFNNKQAALSFTAPLVNTSNTISIPAATSLVDGYLDNLDWVNFNTAYNDSIISAAVTGTTTKTLTLNQQDGGTITASWTDDNTDAVTSVFGRTGAVVAVSGDYNTDLVTEGSTNLYFTNARSRSALSFTAGSGAYNSTTGVITIPTNTSQLTNGANFITLASLSGTAPIQYNNTTGAISITQAGTASNGFLSSTDWNTFNNKQATISLTTTGTSGAATLVGNTLNIPTYTLAGLGGVPSTRNITINGLTQDLSADRTWTITAGVSSVTASSPLFSSGGSTPNITIQQSTALQSGFLSSADWVTFNNKLGVGFDTYGTLYARTAVTTYRDHSISAANDAPLKSLSNTEDNWIYLDSANAQWGIYHRNIDTDLVVAGQPTLPANSIAFIGANQIASYVSLANGNGFFRGTISASNFSGSSSGTNTGDQDLSGYLTTATAGSTYLPLVGGTLTGRLNINVTNNYGVLMNRPAVTNYIGLQYQTNNVNQWFVGLRELNTNHYYIYNEVLGTDAFTISRTNNSAIFSGSYGSSYGALVSGTTYGILGANRGASSAAAGINYYNALDQKWFTGIYENTDNFGFYSVFTNSFPLTITPNGLVTFTRNESSYGMVRLKGSAVEASIGYGFATDTDFTTWVVGKGAGLGDTTFGWYYGGVKMILTTGGNLLVNTGTGVTGGGALQVNGNVNINGVFQINGVTIGGGGGSGVTGSGGTNYITKWTGTSTLGNSVLYESSNNIGIGTTSTAERLVVNGNIISYAVSAAWAEGLSVIVPTVSTWGGIRLRRERSGYDGNWGFGYVGFDSTDDLVFISNNGGAQINNILRLTKAGSVLINTGTDIGVGYKLQVNGSISMAYANFFNFRGSSGAGDVLVDNSGSTLRITGNVSVAGSVTATGGFFDTSDSRLKIVIKDYNKAKGIEKVEARLYIKNNKKELGYFAQEIEEILPSAVGKDTDGYLTLSYSQVHTAKIAYLEKEIAELKELIKSLL